jgi:hypothetical protein
MIRPARAGERWTAELGPCHRRRHPGPGRLGGPRPAGPGPAGSAQSVTRSVRHLELDSVTPGSVHLDQARNWSLSAGHMTGRAGPGGIRIIIIMMILLPA